MSDPQSVEPETTVSPEVPARKRPLWPWIVGGIGLLAVLTVAAAVIVFVMSATVAASTAKAQKAVVEKVVTDFDAAYENADCDAFEALASPEVQDQAVEGGYNCDAWQQVAESFVVGGEYTYQVDITDSEVHGGTATVSTSESWESIDGAPIHADYVYTLKNGKDGWIIVGYNEAS